MPSDRSHKPSILSDYIDKAKPYALPGVAALAAGIGGASIYRAARTPTKALAKGQAFARTLEAKKPKSALIRWLDKQLYAADKIIYTEGRKTPSKPIRFEGHVYHENPRDVKYIRGTSESASVNGKILKNFLEMESNKWSEYKTLNAHIPHALPKTSNLADFLKKRKISKIPTDPEGRAQLLQQLQEYATAKHPRGYFLKDVGGAQSMGAFPTESHDLAALYAKYRDSNIPKRLAEVDTPADIGSEKWDKVWYDLRGKKAFPGHVLEKFLTDPKSVVLQEKIRLRKLDLPKSVEPEMRIHVVGGRAVPELATYRYSPGANYTSPKELRRAAKWVQKRVINKLPKDYANTSYALDVLPSKGKEKYQIVEANPGGMSGFLHPDVDLLATQQLRKNVVGNYGKGTSALVATTGAVGIGGATLLGGAGLQAATKHYNKTLDIVNAPPAAVPQVQQEQQKQA
jgi:hypothetical protein